MSQESAAKAADAAADAIRDLNHLTLSPEVSPDWEYPNNAYDVVGNLARMAMTLPQALDQVHAFIERFHALDNVRSDRGTLSEDLTATYVGLEEAKKAAEALYAALTHAKSGLSHLDYPG